jgi:predicted site-specific integrase-resolvase
MTTSQDRRQRQNPLIVYPFLEWCQMRGFSVSTGRRLIEAGKVKITKLSTRRIGIRSDHDREYLDSCLRDGSAPR